MLLWETLLSKDLLQFLLGQLGRVDGSACLIIENRNVIFVIFKESFRGHLSIRHHLEVHLFLLLGFYLLVQEQKFLKLGRVLEPVFFAAEILDFFITNAQFLL